MGCLESRWPVIKAAGEMPPVIVTFASQRPAVSKFFQITYLDERDMCSWHAHATSTFMSAQLLIGGAANLRGGWIIVNPESMPRLLSIGVWLMTHVLLLHRSTWLRWGLDRLSLRPRECDMLSVQGLEKTKCWILWPKKNQHITLSPIIMEVENYPKWKETIIGETHFALNHDYGRKGISLQNGLSYPTPTFSKQHLPSYVSNNFQSCVRVVCPTHGQRLLRWSLIWSLGLGII